MFEANLGIMLTSWAEINYRSTTTPTFSEVGEEPTERDTLGESIAISSQGSLFPPY